MIEVQQRPEEAQTSSTQALVARQPICERNQRTFAYELLFRQAGTNHAVIDNPEQATAQVIVNSFIEIGLERLVGRSLAFINVTQEFLLGNHCRSLPKDRVVLEILENTVPNEELFRALKTLRAAGYRFALDDFTFQEQLIPLIPYCSFIKVDARGIEQSVLSREIASLRRHPVMLLAEKVETFEEFEAYRQMGFEYFQGYFFCKPKIISSTQVPMNRLSICRLLAKMQQPDMTTGEVESIVGEDIALSFRLLRYINSACLSLPRKIESIGHAVRLVGTDHIRTLASLMMLASLHEKPRELMTVSLVRARMCQTLAQRLGQKSNEGYFTVGLFSALDAFLDRPMEEALNLLPLSDTIREALLTYAGSLGEVLQCVLWYERADWENLEKMQADITLLRVVYLSSVDWAENLIREISPSTAPAQRPARPLVRA